MTSSRLLRIASLCTLVFTMLVSAAPPAMATITATVTAGLLTVTSNEDGDTIDVRCQGGDVSVSGAEPSTGTAACSSITSIQVTAGGGDDRVDLSRVAVDQYTTLTTISVSAGGGNDRVTGSPLGDVLTGEGGNDQMDPGAGSDALDGGKGTDSLSLRANGEVVLTDTNLTHAGGTATLAGFDAADLRVGDLAATASFDASGFSFAVSFIGGGVDDTLIGGPGNDRLSGGDGNDTIEGGPGDDLLSPGTGTAEVLDGGKGTDTLSVSGDGDLTVTDATLAGFVAGTLSRVESLTASGGAGNNRLDAAAFSGAVLLRGDAGNDIIVGGAGDDSMNGGDGDDRLVGGDGDDRVSGDAGDDTLRGGRGDDQLNGGEGKDKCFGGPGTNRLESC